MDVRALEDEPNQSLIFRDFDGDWWWFSKEQSRWGYVHEEQHIGLEDRMRGHYFWSEMAESFGNHFTLRYAGQFVDGKVLRNDEPIQPGQTITIAEPEFAVKDSGAREEYANGFVRDTEDGKYDYARILRIEGLHLIPIEALERWGAHMVKGAAKYGEDNWRQARGPVAVARFLRSLCRHVVQYIRKDRTEDHAAAVCFNVWAAELTPEEE